eukprot:GHVR01035836.1.p1 GENE.GHVR01035836.1~~GHVR01035836.1.p1  ORF type:complete len:440 (-),score=127.93 GHVR01035836.1:224-1543(-)
MSLSGTNGNISNSNINNNNNIENNNVNHNNNNENNKNKNRKYYQNLLLLKPYLGILIALISTVFSSVAKLNAKLSTEFFSVFQVSQCRAITLLFTCFMVMFFTEIKNNGVKGIKNIRPYGKMDTLGWVCLRGIIAGVGHVCLYFSIFILPIGDATTLLSTGIIFGAILASIWLKEHSGGKLLLAGFMSFTGVVLVARPTFIFGEIYIDTNHTQINTYKENIYNKYIWAGVLFAIIAALCLATVNVIVRKIGDAVPKLCLIFSFGTFVIIFSTIGVLVQSPWDTKRLSLIPLRGWIYLLLQATLGFVSQLCIILSFRLEAVGPSGFVQSFNVVWAYIWQVTIMGDIPELTSLFGSAFIVCACFIIFINKYLSKKKEKQKKSTQSDIINTTQVYINNNNQNNNQNNNNNNNNTDDTYTHPTETVCVSSVIPTETVCVCVSV